MFWTGYQSPSTLPILKLKYGKISNQYANKRLFNIFKDLNESEQF